MLAGWFATQFAQAAHIYWTDRGSSELKRMNLDGSEVTVIRPTGEVASPGTNLRGIAVDTANHRLYWADNGADRLMSANLDGSDSRIVVAITGGNSFPADIRLLAAANQFYWCDQTRNRIQRSALDGTAVTDVITSAAPTGPYFMDIDPKAGKLYWGDFDEGSIFRANLDGSGRETLLTGNNKTRGVKVDPVGGMLYWINRDDKKVHRCPLAALANGPIPLTHPAVQTLYAGLDTPHGLAIDVAARKVYWADTGTNAGNGTGERGINRGDMDGSTPQEILATGAEPWDVDLDLRCRTYAEWRMRFFRRDAPAAVVDPDADPDRDGIPNALEYAHGTSPLVPDKGAGGPAGQPKAQLNGPSSPAGTGVPAVSFVRQAEAIDLTYTLVASPTLAPWQERSLDGLWLEAGSTSNEDGLREQALKAPSTLDSSPLFLRVQVNHTR